MERHSKGRGEGVVGGSLPPQPFEVVNHACCSLLMQAVGCAHHQVPAGAEGTCGLCE